MTSTCMYTMLMSLVMGLKQYHEQLLKNAVLKVAGHWSLLLGSSQMGVRHH